MPVKASALRGHLDHVSLGRIAGWAWDPDTPDRPVHLVISANDKVIGRILANRYRADLESARIGDGRFSFDFTPTVRLSFAERHIISLRREIDGTHLPGSPCVLDPEETFSPTMATVVARALAAVGDDTDLEYRVEFLAEQTQKLLQMNADTASGRQAREAARTLRLRLGPKHPDLVRDALLIKRALLIDDIPPRSKRDAGSNALLSHMQALQRIGFDVSFSTSNPSTREPDLEALDITHCARPWYSSVEEVLARQAGDFDLIYLHRASNASRYAALARHYHPKARIIYSVADLHHLRLARQAVVEERPELKPLGERVRSMETIAAWYADAVITHSSFEASLLRKSLSPEKVHLIPWSVETAPTATAFNARQGVAFIGGYGHSPNVDAARWLVEAVMPEVWKLDPTIACIIAGSQMPESLRLLASDRVQAIGEVEQLSVLFDQVRLTVAPLAFGAGIKGKVLDSLAAGIPCVCTPIAAEGMDLPPLLLEQVASEPSALGKLIYQLHENAELNQACAAAGLDYISRFASRTRIDALMRAAAGLPASS
jgi:glycosyltransferase involved in cell wall biosynthesis